MLCLVSEQGIFFYRFFFTLSDWWVLCLVSEQGIFFTVNSWPCLIGVCFVLSVSRVHRRRCWRCTAWRSPRMAGYRWWSPWWCPFLWRIPWAPLSLHFCWTSVPFPLRYGFTTLLDDCLPHRLNSMVIFLLSILLARMPSYFCTRDWSYRLTALLKPTVPLAARET